MWTESESKHGKIVIDMAMYMTHALKQTRKRRGNNKKKRGTGKKANVHTVPKHT
jgi:hypothetical protein